MPAKTNSSSWVNKVHRCTTPAVRRRDYDVGSEWRCACGRQWVFAFFGQKALHWEARVG